jgi:tryptophanyl-tRNA synthetase
MKERVLSGVRSTGNLHLGNYFGAIKNFIQMQEDYEAYFFIANLHALTTHPDPDIIKKISSSDFSGIYCLWIRS